MMITLSSEMASKREILLLEQKSEKNRDSFLRNLIDWTSLIKCIWLVANQKPFSHFFFLLLKICGGNQKMCLPWIQEKVQWFLGSLTHASKISVEHVRSRLPPREPINYIWENTLYFLEISTDFYFCLQNLKCDI